MLRVLYVGTLTVVCGDGGQPGDPHIHPSLPRHRRQRRCDDVDDEAAKQCRSGSRMIVTLDGSLGSSRDQRTLTSPTFATNNRRLGLRLNPLRVSRNDCR